MQIKKHLFEVLSLVYFRSVLIFISIFEMLWSTKKLKILQSILSATMGLFIKPVVAQEG